MGRQIKRQKGSLPRTKDPSTPVGTSPLTNASQISGQRLYKQAQERNERIDDLRQISRTTPIPKMKLATQNHETPLNWGASPNERFLALYEQGKNRLSSQRQLCKKLSRKNVQSSLNGPARYANARQAKLYEHGRQTLINSRKRKLNDTETRDERSDVNTKAGYANTRQIELYELGKQRIIKRRKLTHEVKHPKKNDRYANTRQSELHNLGKRKIIKSTDNELREKQ